MTTTKVLAIARGSNGLYYTGYVNLTDGTEASIPFGVNSTGDTGNVIGTAMEGVALTDLYIEVATPSDLDRVALYNETGGPIFDSIGAITVALGQQPQLEIHGLNIPIKKGYDLKGTTTD